MTESEFFHELQGVLGPAVTISGNESLEDLPEWDSMAKVMFLAMADTTMGRTITATELAACKTVGDLTALFPGKIS